MEENQQNMGVRDKLLFRQLLANLIEVKMVKYVDRLENGEKRRYFWIVNT